VTTSLEKHFRLANGTCDALRVAPLEGDPGFFRWGRESICFGRVAGGMTAASANGDLPVAPASRQGAGGSRILAFDPDEIIENFHYERYQAREARGDAANSPFLRTIYYAVRPWLPAPLRRMLQRQALSGWRSISFPQWPVDTTADTLRRSVLAEALAATGTDSAPFVWFWPGKNRGCAILTFDVETQTGYDFCLDLAGELERHGFRGSFQIVPEDRYEVRPEVLEALRERGHEVDIHGLNHDGRLFDDREEFLRRAERINAYGKKYHAPGFRAPVLYRNQQWFDALRFEFDMTVPNTGALEAQRGGCCTVFPYFIGKLVELPVTTIQDYSLFMVLKDYSTRLWNDQLDRILAENGMASFLMHPDYLIESRAFHVFQKMLGELRDRAEREPLWTPLPAEVARWWTNRAASTPEQTSDGVWRVNGPASDRAHVAHAVLHDDNVMYAFADTTAQGVAVQS